MVTEENEQRSVSPWLWLYLVFCVVSFAGIIACFFPDEHTGLLHFIAVVVGISCAARLKNYRVRRNLHGAVRRESMENGFQEIVRTTADCIKNEYIGDPSIQHPKSGVYHVNARETAISDSKTNTMLHGGFEKPSILTIQVTPISDVDGWSVQGTRKTTGKEFYVISEGFVSPSGKAYWVETCSCQSILVCGDYRGETFMGEWLSSNGDRGRYTDFQQVKVVEADTAIVMGSEASTANDSTLAKDPLLLLV